MAELPFRAEYAKSGRSTCRSCKKPVPKGSLRLAVMVQSKLFDGKQANWYHDKCFFNNQWVGAITDIAQFSTLRYEDQEKIKKFIASPSAKPVKSKGSKRSIENISQTSPDNFSIEYSKSNRATCKICNIKIAKDVMRIGKSYQNLGTQTLWYHFVCFVKDESNLELFPNGESISGFNVLSEADQDLVKNKFYTLNKNEIPNKKIKEDLTCKDSEKVINEEENVLTEEEKNMKSQNVLFYKYRDLLEKNFTKKDLKLILEFNNQQCSVGETNMLTCVADIMCFGALLPCEKCGYNQLSLDTNGYVCKGNLTEWTKCNNITKTPGRIPFKVPDSLQENVVFKKYEFNEQKRIFISETPSKILIEKLVPALKNLHFFIYGYNLKKRKTLRKRILKLGGVVSSKITESLAAVISTPEEVSGMSGRIVDALQNDVQVLQDTFFYTIDPNQTVAETMKLIDQHNIAPWGSSLLNRIPHDVLDGKLNESKERYSKSSYFPTTLIVKDGTAPEPEALQYVDDVVYVYINKKSGDKYSVAFGLTDVVSQKNSFYKLQILKSENGNKFWLFRSWGRIGTTIGGSKAEEYHNLQDVLRNFRKLYLEKTGYEWKTRNQKDLPKLPGKMYPVDIDYSEKKKEKVNLDNSSSKLLKPVQDLVKMIFSVDTMKRTLSAFQLDTKKMPLGNLSQKQLLSGYKVLNSIVDILNDKNVKSYENSIIDATNRFYTLIPHHFGVENPPLLNNHEIIKSKLSMLEDLVELEIAYNLLHSKTETDEIICPLDSHYLKLKSEIIPLDIDCPEYDIINKYIQNTHETFSTYELEIIQAFKVSRDGEEDRFKIFETLPNHKLLWHGSRVTNFAGILSQGLRIAPPEAPATGYMFGKGIYFADVVSKSANYCITDRDQPIGIILLCEVALGNMMELKVGKCIKKLDSVYNSVKGVGCMEPNTEEELVLDCGMIVSLGKPILKKEHNRLMYNEYIVYDEAQVKIKYLLQMKFNFKNS